MERGHEEKERDAMELEEWLSSSMKQVVNFHIHVADHTATRSFASAAAEVATADAMEQPRFTSQLSPLIESPSDARASAEVQAQTQREHGSDFKQFDSTEATVHEAGEGSCCCRVSRWCFCVD